MTWLRTAERRGLGSVVRFAGLRNDRGAVIAGVDVFVSPSRRDGLSSALLEAAAAGAPCVVSSNPSVRAALADGTHALLVPPGDADALAAAVDRLLEDRALARRLGAAARVHVSAAYAVERAVVLLHELHERAAAAAAAR